MSKPAAGELFWNFHSFRSNFGGCQHFLGGCRHFLGGCSPTPGGRGWAPPPSMGYAQLPFFQKETEGPKKRVVLDKQSSSDHTISVFERLQKEEPTALTTTQKVVSLNRSSYNENLNFREYGYVWAQ